jgi:hypothetical protein
VSLARICGLDRGACFLAYVLLMVLSCLLSRLDLTAPTRHLGPRKLLKEGVLSKAKSGRKLRLFLCSDILVLTHESGKGLYRVVSAFVTIVEIEVGADVCDSPYLSTKYK